MKPLPPLSPELQDKVDQFYVGMAEMLDRYISGVELDMNRHAVKHGPMEPERMVFDFTQVLTKQMHDGQLTPQVIIGMLAVAINRGVANKRKGKG